MYLKGREREIDRQKELLFFGSLPKFSLELRLAQAQAGTGNSFQVSSLGGGDLNT